MPRSQRECLRRVKREEHWESHARDALDILVAADSRKTAIWVFRLTVVAVICGLIQAFGGFWMIAPDYLGRLGARALLRPRDKVPDQVRNAICLLSAVLMIIHDRLRSRAAHLDLRAHLFQPGRKRFNLRLLVRDNRFLFCSSGL
jgi:hypothetical protein